MKQWLFILLFGLSTAALAHDQSLKAGALTFSNAWARASVPGQANGAAYFSVRNDGAADRIVAASAPVAGTVELHTHTMDGNVMRMRQVQAMDVAAGSTTELKPGGLHIMLLGLKAPLKAGETFPLTLKLEKAGDVKLDVSVRVVTSSAHGGMPTGHKK